LNRLAFLQRARVGDDALMDTSWDFAYKAEASA